MNTKSKVHLDKLNALLINEKLPSTDIPMVKKTIEKYEEWIRSLNNLECSSIEELVEKMVKLLNEYKLFVDLNLVFDSKKDFLYRQKGQLKLDNTVIEEFLPIFVEKCVEKKYPNKLSDIVVDSQVQTFSSVFFDSKLVNFKKGGGFKIKTKDQDFSISKKLYFKTSESSKFEDKQSITTETNIAYIVGECKTNLDKTMFQEAAATSNDIKTTVKGAKYFLLCEWLDMTPISTATTDIEEVLILRKAKRMSSNIRKNYSSYEGRSTNRDKYKKYLIDNPYYGDVFNRFIEHIFNLFEEEVLVEESVLDVGYF